MLAYILSILELFRPCFSRNASFAWFSSIVLGLMLRTDRLGVTSIVRDLSLCPASYHSLLHFFHSDAWDLAAMRRCWYRAILRYIPICREADAFLLAADGVKQSKEARRMPGVKRMHQESETQTKAESIFGHMWGCIGILAGLPGRLACIPASLRLHDGLREAAGWEDSDASDESHVVQIIRNAYEVARELAGNAILAMDCYFLSVPALVAWKEERSKGGFSLELVTRARKSCTAYHAPPPRKPGQKGRPRRKGDSVKLWSLFDSMRDSFVPARVEMYGKLTDISYYCIDLLWGLKLYHPLRFVLVKDGPSRTILASTSRDLTPTAIIRIYSYRFRIEHTFRELKQQVGGFAYRFWSKSLEKLSHFQKKTAPSPLERATDAGARRNILRTVRAIEMYAIASSVAMGIVQAISLKYADDLSGCLRWQRTPCRTRPSEANVMHYLRRAFCAVWAKPSKNSILRFIQQHQTEPYEDADSWVA